MANLIDQVAIGSDGTTWGRDSMGGLYKREGNEWKRNPTAIARQVVVLNANNVWCFNNSGRVFKAQTGGYDTGWDEDPQASLVTSLAVAPDGSLWVTNAKGEIWQRKDSTWSQVNGPTLTQPKKTYTVKENDTLGNIVRAQYGLTGNAVWPKADEIAKLNKWPNRDKTIYPGDVIMLEA
jgi:hypothetical protein